MSIEDRCFCELAPLYALGLLEGEDQRWVEAQIVECPDLAVELVELQTTVADLAYSAPPMPLAADVKDRLAARLTQAPVEDATTVAKPSAAIATNVPTANISLSDRPSLHRSRIKAGWWIGAAIAALSAIALGVDNYRLRQANQTNQSIIASLQPKTQLYTLKGTNKTAAAGQLVVDPRQQKLVVWVQNLPTLPSGQAYRLWAMPKKAKTPVYCGQFNPAARDRPTEWVAPETACIQPGVQILVTSESATAPPIPAGPLVMQSTL